MGMEGAQTTISTPLHANPPPALMWEQNQVVLESGNTNSGPTKPAGDVPGPH